VVAPVAVVLIRQTPAEVRPASARRRLKRQGVGDQATCDDNVGHGDFDDRIGRRLGVGLNEGAGDVDTAALEAEKPRYRAVGRPFVEGDRTLSGSGDGCDEGDVGLPVVERDVVGELDKGNVGLRFRARM
jgi:hypothetical protein